jgi:TM2 domain-containing membrane protein YozV
MSQPPPPPPPGWYPDPSGAPTQRYFDGTRWTEQLAPFSAPIPPVTWPAAPMNWPAVQGLMPPPKSAVAAGLLQLFLGTFGAGRFYIGTTGIAATQLALGLAGLFFTLFCFVGIFILVPLWTWNLVEAIMMFAGAIGDGYGRKLQ